MLSLAEGLVAGDIGVIAAARKLSGFCDEVEPELATLLNVFVGISSETDALPIGEERTLWNIDALAREDQKIRASEERWRSRSLVAATQLIRLLQHGTGLPFDHVDRTPRYAATVKEKRALNRSDGKRRVLLIERTDGKFGFVEQYWYESIYEGKLIAKGWASLGVSSTICETLEIAEREARATFQWIA